MSNLNTSTSSMSTSNMSTSTAGRPLEQMTFEELVAELETVALAMDRGDIGIEEAADLYVRAGALHSAAADRLTNVQQRLAALRGDQG